MASPFDLTPPQWYTLRRLLDDALALAPAQRADWLARLGAEHAALRPRLRALLAHAEVEGAAALLDTLPKIETGDFALRPPTAPPAQVGPYRLLQEIGRGGMAAVWLAERTDRLQARRVALKLPHRAPPPPGPGATKAPEALARRLQRESEILAQLEHPHIARLYDAGVADDGQPWLAMEHVEGERIDHWCTHHRPGVPQRLRLFVQAARAVAYAHSRLVVHRDLKPANLLVTADGQLRLLDFGIAKLLAPEAGAEAPADSELTHHDGRPLTPAYASPEQLRGQPLGTASDLYSLGVVLYELLTGTRPAPPREGAAPPARPSDVVAEPALARRLRGDLDTIVLKALQERPAERYATADALADDLQRHLDGHPVLARPDSPGYRLVKALRRHRVASAAATAVLAALLGGGALALWQAREALAQAQRAEAVKRFITSVFEDASPWVGPQGSPSAAELLQRAHHSLAADRVADPMLRLELLTTVGASMLGLQAAAQAAPVIADARRLAGATLPATHPLARRAALLELDLLLQQGRIAELDGAVQALLPVLAAPDADRVRLLLRAADVANHASDYRRMEQHARAALGIAAQALPPQHPLQVGARLVLANALENQDRGSESVPFARQAFETAQQLHAAEPLHPQLSEARYVYARVLHRAGELQQALPLFEQAIADTAAVFGADALRVATMKRALVAPLLAAQRITDAKAALDSALPVLQAAHAPDSEFVAYARVARGSIHASLRDWAAAQADYEAALAALLPRIGSDAPYALHLRALRASTRARQGQAAAAAAELASIVERQRRDQLPGLWVTVAAHALALRLAGRPGAALALLDEQAAAAAQPAQRQRWHAERGLALLALGRHGEAAAALQAALEPAAAQAAAATPEREELQRALAAARAAAMPGRAGAAGGAGGG